VRPCFVRFAMKGMAEEKSSYAISGDPSRWNSCGATASNPRQRIGPRRPPNMVVYAEGLLQDDDGARRIGLS